MDQCPKRNNHRLSNWNCFIYANIGEAIQSVVRYYVIKWDFTMDGTASNNDRLVSAGNLVIPWKYHENVFRIEWDNRLFQFNHLYSILLIIRLLWKKSIAQSKSAPNRSPTVNWFFQFYNYNDIFQLDQLAVVNCFGFIFYCLMRSFSFKLVLAFFHPK